MRSQTVKKSDFSWLAVALLLSSLLVGLSPRPIPSADNCSLASRAPERTALLPDAYTIYCSTTSHQGAAIDPAEYPGYAAVEGLIERP
ncbi:MAG: hypothetical protein AB7S38_17960 [Vulcanimicrobiota bacterium]